MKLNKTDRLRYRLHQRFARNSLRQKDFLMDDQTKKILLIITAMAIGLGIFTAGIELGKKAISNDELLEQPLGVAISDNVARINHGGVIITLPAPEQYCFLDKDQPVDNAAITAMTQMQRTYSNHLWLVVANCAELKDVREKNDLSTYIDTGMLVTPMLGLNTEVKGEEFVAAAAENIRKLDPVQLENLVNKNVKENLSPTGQSKPGQPLIYGDDKDALLFSITHDMSDAADNTAFKLTEFDVITAIKERPLVMIFTYKDLKDLTQRQNFTRQYLEEVKKAN